jgi:hypothetical protein
LDIEDWPTWNGNIDNPNDGKEDCVADDASDIEQNNTIENLESPKQWDVGALPNVPGFIWPTWKSK